MKIVQFSRFGPPEQVAECIEAEDPPAPAADEVTLDVLAFPINPADTLTIEGRYAVRPPLPSRAGAECIARVSAIGSAVTDLQSRRPGDPARPRQLGAAQARQGRPGDEGAGRRRSAATRHAQGQSADRLSDDDQIRDAGAGRLDFAERRQFRRRPLPHPVGQGGRLQDRQHRAPRGAGRRAHRARRRRGAGRRPRSRRSASPRPPRARRSSSPSTPSAARRSCASATRWRTKPSSSITACCRARTRN